jgi:pimeloyl-ACP methyl ester carboxylesterase
MAGSLHELATDDGSALQYFIDDEAPADAGLLVYHHGTPGAGPFEDELLGGARAAGLRIAELVRPGYGASTRMPGRRVADVVPMVAALADHLGHERFVTLGWSGGGPHAIATAALLPHRCAGALSLAGVGPFGEADLDFLAGMGQDNIDEFGAALAGAQQLEELMNAAAVGLREASPQELVDQLRSLLPEVDQAVITGDTGEQLAEVFRWALSTGIWGWFDDDMAFVEPWGFSLSTITVPVAVWQGSADLMVPIDHARWLAERIPTAVPHLVDNEGHLSLVAHIAPGMHQLRAWLDAR